MAYRRSTFDRMKSVLGLVVLGACLILLSPGVSLVRADDGPSDQAQECSPEKATDHTKTKAEDRASRVAPRSPQPRTPGARRGDRPAANDDAPPIALNTRGYNYGPDRPTAQPTLTPPPTVPAAPSSE